jgi:hypothetical protein
VTIAVPRLGVMRANRVMFVAIALLWAGIFAMHVAAGQALIAVLSAVPAVLFAAAAALQTVIIGQVKRAAIVRAGTALPVSAQIVAEWRSEARRLGVTPGPCAHPEAVPVDLPVTKERVAWLCPQCDAQLPGEWAL